MPWVRRPDSGKVSAHSGRERQGHRRTVAGVVNRLHDPGGAGLGTLDDQRPAAGPGDHAGRPGEDRREGLAGVDSRLDDDRVQARRPQEVGPALSLFTPTVTGAVTPATAPPPVGLSAGNLALRLVSRKPGRSGRVNPAR